jgi:hypothetical protein
MYNCGRYFLAIAKSFFRYIRRDDAGVAPTQRICIWQFLDYVMQMMEAWFNVLAALGPAPPALTKLG